MEKKQLFIFRLKLVSEDKDDIYTNLKSNWRLQTLDEIILHHTYRYPRQINGSI